MDKLKIKSTRTTPQVDFDPVTGMLEIEGSVILEDANNFFTEIFNWVDTYSDDKSKPIVMRFRLYYYNTSSSKRIFALMRKLDGLFQKGYNVKIVWEYEQGDDDSMQDCEGYKRYLTLPIEMKEYEQG